MKTASTKHAVQSASVHPLPDHKEKPAAQPKQTPLDDAIRLIRMADVVQLIGLQRGAVYNLIKNDPTFPRPVPLTSSTARGAPVAFVLSEVQDWIKARIALRGAA